MRISFVVMLIASVLVACHSAESSNKEILAVSLSESNVLGVVRAAAETEVVSADPGADAADDAAIWYNEKNPSMSLIFGSDKTKGLDVFDLHGNRLHTHHVGRLNNIDVHRDFVGGMDVVAGSNRTTFTIDFWQIRRDSMNVVFLGSVSSQLADVYGLTLYKDKLGAYAFVNSKTGKVEQWRISVKGDSIQGELVRELQLAGQVEGMVADDELGFLYVGVEEGGIFKFEADSKAESKGQLIQGSTTANPDVAYDLEGIALFKLNNKKGYLIASSQGNNGFLVFRRDGDNEYIGDFKIVDGEVDGVSETDGLEVTSLPLGDIYPTGVLICQDGFNQDGENKVAQNFKMVHWRDIARSFEPKLKLKSGN